MKYCYYLDKIFHFRIKYSIYVPFIYQFKEMKVSISKVLNNKEIFENHC